MSIPISNQMIVVIPSVSLLITYCQLYSLNLPSLSFFPLNFVFEDVMFSTLVVMVS